MHVNNKSYDIALNRVEDEISVNRSRFICFLSPCDSSEQAKGFIKEIQLLHPQASHHCYAFVTGAADDSQGYGFSDDGEPSGTAGRPMLAVVQGFGVGQLCAVVVRYFGGTKLGTGGLQRAYSASVRQAFAFLRSETKIAMAHKTLACQYSQVNDVLHVVKQVKGQVVSQAYLDQVIFTLAIPLNSVDLVQAKLTALSSGQLMFETDDL